MTRKRNIQIPFRLSKKESAKLDKLVKKSGLSREAYLRHLICGVIPKEAPHPDFYTMTRQLHEIADRLSRIARSAQATDTFDAKCCNQAVSEARNAIIAITKEILEPGTGPGTGSGTGAGNTQRG